MIRAAALAAAPLREAAAWLASPAARRILALLLAVLAGQLAFAGYDAVALGLPLVREEPAGFALNLLVQTAYLLVVSALLVAALVRARAPSCPLDSEAVAPAWLAAGLAVMAAAAAATALLIADPAAFHAGAQEDRPLEWASALLLLAGAGLFAWRALRRGDGPVAVLIAAGLCLVLAVIGLEEISWGQRLFGFATPEPLAEVNWQQEFNFHNVQTDLFETLFYAGAAGFLILLPLLRDLLPGTAARHPLMAFAPRRSVALLSLPLLWFDYGHWNLYAIQLGAMLALFATIAWSRAAWQRGDRGESALFAFAIAALVVGKLVYLAWGPTMVDLPDATEYKEFFIALGFAGYALTAVPARKAAG